MTVSTIILAAGKGTRMKSPTPKILHKIAGKHLIAFSVDLAKAVKSKEIIVVVGDENEQATKVALSGEYGKILHSKKSTRYRRCCQNSTKRF
ncbi:MAG: hypothetical protein CM15mP98_12310 [Paracoccaceae bacterium]|nr:MAG: hypothetical protein CM15mP98_12310 [Paracoccaceae bacterium]